MKHLILNSLLIIIHNVKLYSAYVTHIFLLYRLEIEHVGFSSVNFKNFRFEKLDPKIRDQVFI